MIEKPPVDDELIRARLGAEYGLDASQLEFLPLGVDVNSAVYRITAGDEGEYFLNLRSGPFKETSVSIPTFLHGSGVRGIIPPVGTRQREGWGSLGDYRMILYPYVHGQDAYQRRRSETQ